MFRRIRVRFILIASLAISAILISIVGVINSVRYYQTKQEIARVLQVILDNNGELPNVDTTSKQFGTQVTEDTLSRFRYYSVKLTNDNVILSTSTDYISAVSQDEAEEYGLYLLSQNHESGHFEENGSQYDYRIKTSDSEVLVVVLDTTSYYENVTSIFIVSSTMSFGGLIFFIIIVSLLSGRAIKPFVENYEKQRRFITNAGHELKTPLAIISANNELTEMMSGENEWTKSTADQVERLTGLINQMVTLARLEEQPDIVLKDVDFSDIAEDAAEDFKGPVVRDGKTFHMDIEPGIHVKAEEKSLFELVTILVDNANKYCDPNGNVSVELTRERWGRRHAKLVISNTYVEGKNVDYTRFFERFYREDESHSSEKNGYGIGLSMAESMVKLFHGSIAASYKEDAISFTVLL